MAIHLITVSALILAVLLVRAVFRKKVPARLIYALWLVVAVKLCMPFSLFALELPSTAEVPQTEQTATQTQDAPVVSKAPEVLTPITPIASQQPIVSQQIGTKPSEPMVPTVPVTPITPVESSATAPAAIESIETEVAIPEAPTVVETTPIDWAHIAKVVWFVGLVIMAVWFAVSGTVFHQRLCADRRLHTTVGRTKVYVSKSAGAPCLAGLIPAIYLTPAAVDSPSEHFVITHEYTHLRHGDHVWAVLRTVALIVYWWNPLVWAAAMVSKQDAELACDEAVAAKLDDSQRLAYAHTILDTIPQKHAHAVGLGSAPIKERILMLTKRHKNRVVAAILAVALTLCAVGCSFIGPKETTEPVEDTDLPSSIATAQTTDVPPEVTTAADVQNTPVAAESPVRVLSNDGNLNIHTVMLPLENEDMRFYDISSTTHSTRYRMFLEYDNSAGKPYQYRRLYVVDALNGEIADCFDLDIQAGLPRITYTDNGGVIYAPITDPVTSTLSSYYMLTVTEKNGEFSLQKTEMQADAPLVTSRFASPDGRYVAYQTEETSGDYGGIYLQSSDGSSQCICENKTAADVASAEVRLYSLTGFADDRHLVYSIHGDLQKVSGIGNGQLPIGYGIYNTETGERTEVHNGKVPIGICDGTLYLGTYSDMVPQEIWRAGIDGEEELIASRNAADGVFAMTEERLLRWDSTMWHRYFSAENASANTTQVEFYSPDFDQKLAEVSYWKTDMILSKTMVERFLICEDSVTFVVPYVVEKTAQSTVKVLSNAGNLDIHAVLLPLASEDTRYLCFSYTDRYKIYLTYTYATEHTGYYYNYFYYDSLYIVDAAKGEIVYTDTIDAALSYSFLADSGNGFVLYATEGSIYAVQEHDGEFVRCKVYFRGDPIVEQRFVSPSGTYTAYKTVDDAGADGGIDIRYPDGSEKRILENIMLEETDDINGVTGYVPIGFVSDTELVYRIDGWEGTKGYGIYNAATGERIETKGKYYPAGIYDGAFFVVEHQSNSDGTTSPCAIWQVTPDGERTKIAPSDGNASLSIIAETGYPTFEHSMWYTIETEDVCKVTLYSPDFDSQELAVIECPYTSYDSMKRCLLIYQSSVTVVVPYLSATENVYAEASTADTEFYTSVETVGSTYYTDLTGDGVAEICTVKVWSRGANSYIEDITVTDGQSGETIAVGDPRDYTDHNSLLHVGGDADTVVCREVDYTVRDGVLMCCMRRSGIVGDDTKSWTLSYTYSYVAGELVITSARLRDDMTDEVTDFGTLEPTPSLPTDLIELLHNNVAMIRLNTQYGELKLSYSEYGSGMPVYSIENVPGVFVQFYRWDMHLPLTESMIPDAVILDKDYTDTLNGLAIGKNIEDCTSLITWEDASYALIDGVAYVQTTIGEYTLTARMVTDQPGQWNLPDESTATDAEWDVWQDAYRQNPTGEIVELRIQKVAREQTTTDDTNAPSSAVQTLTDSMTYIDIGGAYMPVSYIQDGKQLLTGYAVDSLLAEDILKDAPKADSLQKQNNLASDATWNLFSIDVQHTVYTPENQPEAGEWSAYFTEKLASQNTPAIITEAWSFTLNGRKAAIVVASNVTVSGDANALYTAGNAHAAPNPPAADSTVLYRIQAIFVAGSEPQDLYSESITVRSGADAGNAGVSYLPFATESYEQIFSAWQYDASGRIVECPIFNTMSGGYQIRDYAYSPEYTVCDIDADGAAEVICYDKKASSVMSLCAVYQMENGEFEKVFHLVLN